MIHIFKVNGERFVFDRGSGAVSTVSALQYKMLSYLKPPLTEELPSALRYDLAKYDGGMVEDAYEGLYRLYCGGRLFAPDEDGGSPECSGCWARSRCGFDKACDTCGAERHRLELSLAGEAR